MESPCLPTPPQRGPIRRWIIDHDDSWLFVALYITLAVVLSIWISLFWLIVVVGAHFALEIIRHRHFDRWWPGVIVRALWEIKLDIALVIFALLVGVYMEFVLGIAGLSGAARVGLQSGARFAGWQRAIRGILLSVDDGAQVARAIVRRRPAQADDSDADHAPQPSATHTPALWGGWTGRWSIGDRVSIGLGLASLALLIAAPLLLDRPAQTVLETILTELHPLPPRTP